MTTVYVVAYAVGGYAREDADTITVGGVYSDEESARIHAKVVHGHVTPIEIDTMPKGIMTNAKQLGLIK